MSLLVIGLSHRTAPIAVLEAVAGAPVDALAYRISGADTVGESVILSTCNRLEVYAEAVTFQGRSPSSERRLADSPPGSSRHKLTATSTSTSRTAPSLTRSRWPPGSTRWPSVRRRSSASSAMRSVTGSARARSVSRSTPFCSKRFGFGKRAHHETAIDTVSRSLVEAGLDQAERLRPPRVAHRARRRRGWHVQPRGDDRRPGGVGDLLVANRTLDRGERLAESTGGRAVEMERLVDAIAAADVVVSSTGSAQYLIGADLVAAAAAVSGHERVFVDLALPHDVDPAVSDLPGTTVVGLADLGAILAEQADVETLPEVQAVRDLVTGEVAGYLASQMVKSVAPTVAALRSRAAAVVAGEMERLDHRLPDLDDATRQEVQHAVHRVVEKLLHTPTVRIKELTSGGHGEDYAAALRELFDLDPHTVAAVSTPPTTVHHELGGAS